MTGWLVCDYGEVLSQRQPDDDRAELVGRSGLGESLFWQRYWQHRPDYDRSAVGVHAYWGQVLGGAPSDAQLEALVRIDVASWCYQNPAAVAAALRAAGRGYRLALLSNAPIEVARAIEQLPWLSEFTPRIFSCDIGAVKPDPAIYRSVIATLGADPGSIVFVDDRSENVSSAARLGMRAVLFTEPSVFDGLPPAPP
ncbi:MAG: HAD-IA family hydrolase [Actinomycetota bacterium]|nr:HAD-IA family hydrolase [Actinomycetota bacterium]